MKTWQGLFVGLVMAASVCCAPHSQTVQPYREGYSTQVTHDLKLLYEFGSRARVEIGFCLYGQAWVGGFWADSVGVPEIDRMVRDTIWANWQTCGARALGSGHSHLTHLGYPCYFSFEDYRSFKAEPYLLSFLLCQDGVRVYRKEVSNVRDNPPRQRKAGRHLLPPF